MLGRITRWMLWFCPRRAGGMGRGYAGTPRSCSKILALYLARSESDSGRHRGIGPGHDRPSGETDGCANMQARGLAVYSLTEGVVLLLLPASWVRG